MRKTLILSAAIAVIAMLCGCGATQPTTSQTAKTDSVKILPLSTADMQALPETPNAEVLTLKDASSHSSRRAKRKGSYEEIRL